MATDALPLPDAPARAFATDPRENVVLEASAGTGKTTVLVTRYLNLLAAGVDPRNVLAITFTRKAAAEMRDRIVGELRGAADRSPEGRERWRALRDRLADIGISTIDAFCLALLREFPLEADLDPAFSVADETEAARLRAEAVDEALRFGRYGAGDREDLRLVLASFTGTQLRRGLDHLLDRRLVAPGALARFLDGLPEDLAGSKALERVLADLVSTIDRRPGGLDAFVADGPVNAPWFRALSAQLRAARAGRSLGEGQGRVVIDALRRHFLSLQGLPRQRAPLARAYYASDTAYRRHGEAIRTLAAEIKASLDRFTRDLNGVLARGLRHLFIVSLVGYRRRLAERDAVDFAGALERAVDLLGQMDEFAQSRYRLESRYHHVLLDEMQDTSRVQWQLVSRLVESWGQGAGLVADAPLTPSIFVVGDRKQSIYRFRDAAVSVLDDASRYIAALRPGSRPRRSIAKSFRALPELLAFVNDVFDGVPKVAGRTDAFSFGADDRFPIEAVEVPFAARGGIAREPALGAIAERSVESTAEAAAGEIARLLAYGTVRDRATGVSRAARAGDVAVLFRARESHRAFEDALDHHGIPAYVYKGLGFFDTDEIRDVVALLGCLASPASPSRVAAFLRSRLVRLSDPALLALRADLPTVLVDREMPAAASALGDEDRGVLTSTRAAVQRWLSFADRLPPADLIDLALDESAYAFEIQGPRATQAIENVKKLRGHLRRLQNRGYATLNRMAEQVARVSAGEEANAVVDAVDAVNLMTVHAAKGLEFPVVFVVSLGRGVGGRGAPVRVIADAGRGEPAVSMASLIAEASEEDRAGEREETKRLLYVAMTRARDRLYLAAEVPETGPVMRPASLGESLPPGLRELFREAAGADSREAAVWAGPSGRRHDLRLCRPAAPVPAPAAVGAPARVPAAKFGSIDRPPCARHVGALDYLLLLAGETRSGGPRRVAASDVLAGRIVHRLFQMRLPAEASASEVTEAARRLISFDDAAQIDDEAVWLANVSRAFAALRGHAAVHRALDDAEVYYEVPFSMRLEGGPPVVVHGVVDAIARRPDGTLVVVEIKTGRPAPWHQAQVALYEEAVRRLYPGQPVVSVLAHPDSARPSP